MNTAMSPLRLGTRGSPLALIQARAFIAALNGMRLTEKHVIRTTGDVVQDRRLADIGGKGLFAKEIHDALITGRIDCAVHSLKDLETTLPPGVVLGCVLPREDPRDALILGSRAITVNSADPFGCLPRGAVVGTAAVRRQAQMLHARPDLTVTVLRGNVGTRLAKLEAGECDGTLLAYAGLLRLDMAGRANGVLDPEVMVPAAGQGIIAITVREDDEGLRELLATIEDPHANAAATAERAMLAVLDGSCRTPIGAHARLGADRSLRLTGLVARPDGSFLLKRSLSGPVKDAACIGHDLGTSLRTDSPRDLFA